MLLTFYKQLICNTLLKFILTVTITHTHFFGDSYSLCILFSGHC